MSARRVGPLMVLLASATLVLAGCGGGGTVYVGVGPAGPWGYPPGMGGYYPRPYGGRPCCWDDDAQQQEDGQLLQQSEWELLGLVYGAPPALVPDPEWMSQLR